MICAECGQEAGENPICACGKRMGAELVGTSGAWRGKSMAVGRKGATIGRAPGNTLVLNDTEISRNHASLEWIRDKWVVEDSSANGTFVNGERVERAELATGDLVQFGLNFNFQFLFRAGPAPREPLAFPSAAPASHAAVPGKPMQALPGERNGTPNSPALETVKPAALRDDPRAEAPRTILLQREGATAPRVRLQMVFDSHTVRDIPLRAGATSLGSRPMGGSGSEVVSVDHPSVAPRHAQVELLPDGSAVLTDLGFPAGTSVNGERVRERRLEEGDLIQLGECPSPLLLFRASRPRTQIVRDYDLASPVVRMGRDATNGIRLDHPTVSAFHAEIRRSGDSFELVDLGSSNGTYVNGERIERRRLNPRDKVMLGAVQLAFDGAQFEQQADGTRVRLCARGLSRRVRDKDTGKDILLLDDISIALNPCEFIGLLGPSGAGKSTLMDALNGFRPADKGDVFLNGQSLYRSMRELRPLIGYLPQDDILHRSLTVRECLTYSARLRLPSDHTDEEIAQRVREVVDLLNLGPRADALIEMLSGGQRKRVSLGIELLAKPSLLFMDEPTAGQDPRTELRMMQMFRSIANRGSTVVLNTHLLGSFSLLDKVAVLVRGKLAFFGPGEELLPYFQCQRVEQVFDLIEARDPSESQRMFRASQLYKTHVEAPMRGVDAAPSSSRKRSAPAAVEASASPSAAGARRQFTTLVSRQRRLRFQDKGNLAALFLPPVAIAVLTALIGHGANEAKTLFMAVLVALWFGCSSCVREIVDEMAIYRRERRNDLSLSSYLGSKLVYLAAVAGLQSVLFVSVLTLLPGLSGIFHGLDGHFLGAWGICWMLGIQGGLIGLLISSFASSAEKALYAFPLAMIPQLLLAGLLIPVAPVGPQFYPSTVGDTIRLVPVPSEIRQGGMSPLLRRAVAPWMVSRWGMEALVDLYLHDYETGGPEQYRYSIPLMDAMSITFHPEDQKNALEILRARLDGGQPAPRPARANEIGRCLAILAGFAFAMVGAIAFTLRWREEHSHAH